MTYGHDHKDKIANTSQNEFPSQVGWAHPSGSGEELCYPGGARSRVVAPPHRKEPAEVVWASVLDASWSPRKVFRACPTGKRPHGKPRKRWRDYASELAWRHLGVPPEQLEEVCVHWEVRASLLRLLPSRPSPG